MTTASKQKSSKIGIICRDWKIAAVAKNRYDWSKMKVGDSMIVATPTAAYVAGRRLGWRFATRANGTAWIATRLS